MKKSDLKKLTEGQRVSVTGEQDYKKFEGEVGTVISGAAAPNDNYEVLIRFDTWSDGHGVGNHEWFFGSEQARKFDITVLPEPKPEPKPRKRPHGKQEYKGNGKHDWEAVAAGTRRLRVPGGWLYQLNGATAHAMTFVPVPNAVGYAV